MSKANARFPLAGLTAALLCVALAACGGGGDSSPAPTQSNNTNTNNTNTTNATTFAAGANLKKPDGIARDSAGNFYVADQGNFVVKKISADGKSVSVVAGTAGAKATGTEADAGPTANVLFSDLRGVAVSADGTTLYVIDGATLKKISLGAGGTFGTIYTDLNNANGIAVDANDNLYVAETGAHAIRRGSPDSGTTIFQTNLTGPKGVAISNGSLYITDVAATGGATTVKTIANVATAAGATGATAVAGATGFTNADGIAVDAASNTIYVVEPKAVSKIVNGAKTTTTVNPATELHNLAVVGNDVYATDFGANQIVKVTLK